MRSKNSRALTDAERAHIERVKSTACACCDADPPSSAHHIVQGDHYTTVGLCWECHQGTNGWHGARAMWRIRKMDEIRALNITLARVMALISARP